jgi:protein SCO1/2
VSARRARAYAWGALVALVRAETLAFVAALALAPAAALAPAVALANPHGPGFTSAAAPVLDGGAPAADAPPGVLGSIGIDQRLGETVPLDLLFRDENGAAVRLGDLFGGKPVVLALVYYECPMLCTHVLNGLTSALSVLKLDVGREFNVITLSFNPAESHELAAAKKHTYVERYGRAGAAEGWRFLTGDSTAIAALTEAVGFRYAFDEEMGEFAHASGITVLTPQGTLSRYFYGIEYSPRDLRLGLIEAADGRIGTPVDKVLLYCYRYDPATGKYGAVAMNMVRVGGIVTVLTLSGFLIVSIRHDKRRGRGAGDGDGVEAAS